VASDIKIKLGAEEYNLRFSFRALKEIREAFGKPVQTYLAEVGSDITETDIATVFEAALRAGGNVVPIDQLLDLMEMPLMPYYTELLTRGLGGETEGKKVASETTE